MEQKDFYEVNGCEWFIPVDLIEENKCTKELEVVATESGRTAFVPRIYKFEKVEKPEKVVVPKFVAELVEECKRSGLDLQVTLSRLDDDEKVGDWAYDENDDLVSEKIDMVARAWLDGYTVEKEKLYTVEIPNPNGNSTRYGLCKVDGRIIIGSFVFGIGRASNAKLTEAEIKEDFEWAFQFAKLVEE